MAGEVMLEIVTRCFRRPRMLAVNQAALARQTSTNWVQTLLVDEVGIGMAAAQARLADVAPALRGEYIWQLDDDDECVCEELTALVEELAATEAPDLIMVRVDHGELGVLPPRVLWGCRPVGAQIGGSGVIVRRELWQQCADAWRTGRYMSDYDFVSAVYDAAERVVWLDVVAARVQRISRGAPE